MEGKTFDIKHDGSIRIAVGRSRNETNWRNQTVRFKELAEKLAETTRTHETCAEYDRMSKDDQSGKKDVGGFVGGSIEGGRRKAGSVKARSLLTLDMDYGRADAWTTATMLFDCSMIMYSTHSHRTDKPRFRFVIPLSREVDAVAYEAIARRTADQMGIDLFDDTTYQAERLMFWPSTSKDGEYVFEYQDGPWLDVDEVLGTYKHWRDVSEWPRSSRVDSVVLRSMKQQGDPLEKPGLVGAFCRTYDIHEAIDAYLTEEYIQCAVPDRYTYLHGSSAAGLVVYDGKFAFSHHSTDPACGKLCNAFDLVRIHLFGDLDEGYQGKDITKAPSYREMCERARLDKAVSATIGKERMAEASKDFEGVEAEDTGWMEDMDITKKGEYTNTPKNYEIILLNDPNVKGLIALDEFSGRVSVRGRLPWRTADDREPLYRDDDESGLYLYINKTYQLQSKGNLQEAIKSVARQNAYHPVKEFLEGLHWDGVERLDTLFVDYLGVESSPYTCAATRKAFTAAVARIYKPGTKFDYMPVLVGKQGVGKSRLMARMAVKAAWFADNFSVEGKEAAENIQGKWLIEAAELSGFKKSEATAVKAFVSRTQDHYRAAFERYTLTRPRQCVFFGTTNEYNFLRDDTGDRRFWPLEVREDRITKTFEDLDDYTIHQVWAEALHRYRSGESLYLTAELEAEARRKQAEFAEVDDRLGLIEEYLDKKLPEDWDSKDIPARRAYIAGDALQAEGSVQRTKVCVLEVWCECFGRQKGDLRRLESKDITALMRKIKGWEFKNTTSRFGPYGTQKYFVKKGATL